METSFITEILIDYGMFILKLLTIVFAVMLLLGFFASLVKARGRPSRFHRPELEVHHLNDGLERIASPIKHQLLSKKERKKEQKRIHKQRKEKMLKGAGKKKVAYVLHFKGDIQASQVEDLAHMVSALISVAKAEQEVILKLESAGGFVHAYGLATAQLLRLKNHKLKLTICVDRVAASGGYMMAAVADNLIAAPFAILGSIGVIGEIPNIHELLRAKKIDIEQHTAGEYKRTLTVLGKNTPKGRKKFIDDLNRVHQLFKDLIKEYRPQLSLKKVATGEIWFGKDALKLNLIDKMITSDEYLLSSAKKANLFEIRIKKKKKFSSKIGDLSERIADRCGNLLLSKLTTLRLFPKS